MDEGSRAHLAARYGHAARDVLRLAGAARSWPRGSARSCPTSPRRRRSRPATSRRARSRTCCCAAPGSGCSTPARCARPTRTAPAARRGRWRRAGLGRGAQQQELRDWADVSRREGLVPGREVRAGGGRMSAPLLMGIVNATPDSFSDRQGEKPLDALVERAHELAEAGAAIDRRRRGVGAHRSPGRPGGGGTRARRAADRTARGGRSERVGRHLARTGRPRRAGRGRVDGQRRERAERRRGGRRVRRGRRGAGHHAHPRAAQGQGLPRLRRRRRRRDRAAARARRAWRASAAWGRSG